MRLKNPRSRETAEEKEEEEEQRKREREREREEERKDQTKISRTTQQYHPHHHLHLRTTDKQNCKTSDKDHDPSRLGSTRTDRTHKASSLDPHPHELTQPATRNRILLSIKSTLPEDIDFALELLLDASCYQPELVAISSFAGLIDALIDLIQLDHLHLHPFQDIDRQATRRRSLEATLILRNLLSIDSNLINLPSNHPRLITLILSILHHSNPELHHESISLLLDLIDSLNSQLRIRLDQPILLLPPSPSTQPPQWPSDLIQSLDRLTQSSDRALVLAAYRALTGLGSPAVHRAILTNELFPPPSDPPNPPSPWPLAIHRALVLLALPDLELLMVVLDYLYTITSIDQLALSICCLHRDILGIFKLLLVHVHHHCKIERDPPESLPIADPKWYFQPPPTPKPLLIDLTNSDSPTPTPPAPQKSDAPSSSSSSSTRTTTPQTLTMSEVHQILLSESELADIVHLPEPKRAHQWMLRVFEPFPGAEVQQVTLWLAYKTQFEHHHQSSKLHPAVQMIAPADAIKLTSDVFPNALPSVTELKTGEKKFVISGMRVRPKKRPVTWKCRWKDCTKSSEDETIEEARVGGASERLYKHLEKSHIAPRASKCYWLSCSYQASNRTQLLFHIRTHLVSRASHESSSDQPPSSKNNLTATAAAAIHNRRMKSNDSDSTRILPFRSYAHERWETPNSGIYHLGDSAAPHPSSSSSLLQPPNPTMVAGSRRSRSRSGSSSSSCSSSSCSGGGGGATGIGFVSILILRNFVQAILDSLMESNKFHDHDHDRASMMELDRAPPASAPARSLPRWDRSDRREGGDGWDDDDHGWRRMRIEEPYTPGALKPAGGSATEERSRKPTDRTRLIRVAHLIAGYRQDDGHDQLASRPPSSTQDTQRGLGFIEAQVLRLIARDVHLQSIGFDLIDRILSIEHALFLLSSSPSSSS